jgi:hypothetical protein
MYEIVCVSDHAPSKSQSERSTIAAGFEDRSAAWQTMSEWLRSFFPNSSYDEEEDCWCVHDTTGQTHRVFVSRGSKS